MVLSESKQKWSQMLTAMLADYKHKNPHDKRTDLELLNSLMQRFYDDGLIGKTPEGKWLLPEIEDAGPLIN